MRESKEDHLTVVPQGWVREKHFCQFDSKELEVFLSTLLTIEEREPEWKDPVWAIETQTRSLIKMLDEKGQRTLPEERFHAGIAKMMSCLEHPYMIVMVLEHILAGSTTEMEILDGMENFVTFMASAQRISADK